MIGIKNGIGLMKKWDQFCYIGLIIGEERILFKRV
jgi:hypothetical protein